MKRMALTFKFIILFCTFFIIYKTSVCQSYIDNKKIVKAFKVLPGSIIDVSNKYGKIQVLQSKNDSLKIGIEVTAKSDKEENVENMIDNIDFDISQNAKFISVKTLFNSDKDGIVSGLFKQLESMITSKNQIIINYIIVAPKNVDLKIENKYGDVMIDEDVKNLQLSLSNGNLKANEISGKCDLSLKFCNSVDIKSIEKGTASIQYADNFEVGSINELNLTSKSSTIRIDEINTIKLDSKTDKIYINNLGKVFGESYFTNQWFYKVREEISYQTKYGKLNLEEIAKTFTFINIDSKFTDINMTFENGASYNIDVTHKNNKLTYPINLASLKEQPLTDKKQTLTYGTIGKGTPTGKVKIIGENSAINIQHK